eukprot:3072469-Prymnesium_polylepis.1
MSVTRRVAWPGDLKTQNFDPTRRKKRTVGWGGLRPTQTLSSSRSKSTPRLRPNRWAALLRTFRAEDRSTATQRSALCERYRHRRSWRSHDNG